MKRIPEGTAPNTKNTSHSITADVEITKGKNEGVVLTQGGRFGGWALFLRDGKPVYHYNLAGVKRYEIAADQPLSPGEHVVRFEFDYDGGGPGKGGMGTLLVDGTKVAEGRIERTMGFRISLDETFDVGLDTGEPATEDYHVPFTFTGDLKKVVVRLGDN